MTNGEKFKTAGEREMEFEKFCIRFFRDNCSGCRLKDMHNSCQFYWLELEAEEEKPLPCPFCGCEVVHEPYNLGEVCQCKCGYRSPNMKTWNDAIAAHNRVAKAVMESEAK